MVFLFVTYFICSLFCINPVAHAPRQQKVLRGTQQHLCTPLAARNYTRKRVTKKQRVRLLPLLLTAGSTPRVTR